MNRTTVAILLGAALTAAGAAAAPADHWTQADLLKTAQGLKAKAAATGSASNTLATYTNHHTMLAYRTKDGGAEVHTNYADVFYVVRGQATLLTEGTVQNSKEESPGEIRGTGIDGATSTVLKKGDFVHIPAGTPHQLLIPKGKTFVYFVIKVKES